MYIPIYVYVYMFVCTSNFEGVRIAFKINCLCSSLVITLSTCDVLFTILKGWKFRSSPFWRPKVHLYPLLVQIMSHTCSVLILVPNVLIVHLTTIWPSTSKPLKYFITFVHAMKFVSNFVSILRAIYAIHLILLDLIILIISNILQKWCYLWFR
jgi:hypothetical protein